ncbi:MAG: hypothetical protein ACOCYD_00255 [bacterium]
MEEDLTFEITDSVFIVQGLYFFSSPVEKDYLIVYPFPSENTYGHPFDIQVIDVNTSDTLAYKMADNQSSMAFTARISAQTQLYITYSQTLKSNKARYILMSTRSWNKPLERAEYKLLTDTNLVISGFSMPPGNTITVEGKHIYIWQKENFMPEKDFEVEFE